MLVDPDAVRQPAFGLADELPAGPGQWHHHRHHQLLYAVHGTLVLEVSDRTWWLPPQRAAWIGSGVEHRVRALRPVGLRTVYFAADVRGPPWTCRVFTVRPLARELILEAMRWGPDHEPDPVGEAVLGALCALAGEWAEHAAPFSLPRGRSEGVQRALRWLQEHATEPDVSVADTARVAGMSPRTLERHLRAEVDATWRELLRTMRLLRAMDLLCEPDTSVTEACLAVGYRSVGTFSRAFTAFVGESPSAWRARHG
jgi:AraC-like DNA-binding protein/mannose-6-phosphate isomerase-like protein (cupin superfamily)